MNTPSENIGSPVRYRVRTATGIEIGGAYVPKPPLPSQDAEVVQAALLARNDALTKHGKRVTRYKDAAIEAAAWVTVTLIVAVLVSGWMLIV